MTSDTDPPRFVLLADFGPDGLSRPQSDASERIAALFADLSWNDSVDVGVAANDPLVAALRRTHDEEPPVLGKVHDAWRHVLALRSRTHLEIIEGQVVAHLPATQLFSRVREAAGKFVDFRGRERPITQIIDVRLCDRSASCADRSWRDTNAWLVERAMIARRVLVVGRPGSGKSMLLRKLLYDLNAGELRRLGPALRFDARRLRGAADPWQAIARQIPRATREEAEECVDAPALRGSVWLLVDGLDELSAPAREDLLEWLRGWPGPLVATSRHLPRAPSDFAAFEVKDLTRSEVEALLRQDGRDDLIEPPETGWRPSHGIKIAPWDVLRRDLCKTPLGVGLLALPSTSPMESRTDLLRRVILELLHVAEKAGRISERVRRWCERKGIPVLGALAWRMLQRGHASLTGDDLGSLEGVGGLTHEEADLLHQLLEAGGFVQRVGPAEWEFTHKSFAEYCAATHLASAPEDSVPLALLARIADPGAQQVVLYLAALRADESYILEQLLAHPGYPLTGASLATRVLLERPPGAVSVEVAVQVLRRRLRLATRLVNSELPGRLHVREDIDAAILRHAVALSPARAALYAACHEDAREWLAGRDQDSEPHAHDGWRTWAEPLFRNLEPNLSAAHLVRLHDGAELLAARKRGAWADELRPLLSGSGETARRARIAWLRGAPLHHLLERISDLDHERAGADEILTAVLRYGSLEQRREALLRHQLSALAFSYRAPGDSPARISIFGRLCGLTSAHWLSLWDWAWSAGLLGSAYAPSHAVQQLYASFARDPSGPARWRALIARSQLEKDSAELPLLWRSALDDSFRPVRVEALRRLVDAEAELPPEYLRGALVSLEAAERLLAWEWLTRTGLRIATDMWLTILPGSPAQAYGEDRVPAPALPSYDAAVEAHAETARRRLLLCAAKTLTSDAAVDPCLEALDRPELEATARELLQRVSHERQPELSVRVLASGSVKRRRWAVDVLSSYGWQGEPEVDSAMTRAVDDSDDEVAKSAREYLERRRQAAARTPALPTRPRARAVAPDLEDVAMAFKGRCEDDLVEQISVAELREYTRFEDVWTELERRVIPWQSFQDMDGFATEEGPEHIGELAGQARSRNFDLRRTVLEELRRLYQPQAHRRSLISGLREPLRGYWAALLLAEEPRAPDLLPACAHGELACVRVARLAIDSDLAFEAASAMSAALRAGVFAPPKPPAEPYMRSRPPRWPALLMALDGLECLLRLLHGEAPEWVHTVVLEFIEEHRAYALKSTTEAERGRTAVWARQVDEADVPRWTLALHLLSVVGDGDDARRWCKRLAEGCVPEPVAVAALELVGRLGDSASLPTLREVAETTEQEPLLVAALDAIAEHGGRAESDWMFALLDRPPPATRKMQSRADAWARSDARNRKRRWEDRERPDFPRPMSWDLDRWRWPCYRAIVRFGDRAQAQAIARMLVDDRAAVRLLQRYGRLPEHALLVFGALRHAPQDHVIPWQITGGGDEVVTDDTALRVGGTVVDFARCVGTEDVRVAFLRAAFWGERDQYEAVRLLDELGGPQPRDAPELLQHLAEDPGDPLALELLARAGAGEAGIVACWRQMAVPWWSDTDAPTTVPLRSWEGGLRELLLAQFIDDPDGLRPFVRRTFGDEAAAALPGPRADLSTICEALVVFLERRGLLDTLADALLARSPAQGAEFRLLRHTLREG